MRGLSLWQPYASLIAWGEKRVETRNWSTPYRGRLAIHATKAFPEDAQAACFFKPFSTVLVAHGVEKPADLPLRAIVAVVRLVDVRGTGSGTAWPAPWIKRLTEQEQAFGYYGPRRFGWFFEDVQVLTEPVPCRGAQGLFRLPDDVVVAIDAQIGVSHA